ncbi:MAG: aromatic ring-opening dioxygenase LigA [Acidimicrobiales bacterium]
MEKMPRVVAMILFVSGGVLVFAGVLTYGLVRNELSDEHITVSEDADHFAGDQVEGPLTAYEQASTIEEHALEIGGGKTYAELPRDDPNRDTVMDASFLRASLFTSVVAFGVAALVVALGVLFVLVGFAVAALDHRLAPAIVEPAPTAA